MTEYSTHDPEYSGTTTADWSAPQKNEFGTDDLSEIADAFVLSASGFPPAKFTDLQVPVVDPDGDLNLNALETAHGGAHGVGSVEDLDDETESAVRNRLEELANEEFDHDLGE
jgi:hypothetical protein